MSSVGVEVRGVLEKVEGKVAASLLDSQVEELDWSKVYGAEVHLEQELASFRADQSSERLSTDVIRKEDTGHECSFCCSCWTDE